MSVATVIDLSKGIAPRAFDRASIGANDPAIRARLARLQSLSEGRDAHGILSPQNTHSIGSCTDERMGRV